MIENNVGKYKQDNNSFYGDDLWTLIVNGSIILDENEVNDLLNESVSEDEILKIEDKRDE